MENVIKELREMQKDYTVKTRKYGSREFTYIVEGTTEELLAKECNTCGAVKLKEDFNKHTGRFGNVQSHCKECVSMYYEQKRDKMLDVFRANYKKNKRYFEEYYRQEHVIAKTKMHSMNVRAEATNSHSDITGEQIEELLEIGECFLSGSTDDVTTDHVIPLSLGGDNSIENLILLKSTINISKSNRNIYEWYHKYSDRHNVSLERFNNTISYLATLNGLTIDEYRQFVNWAHSEDREEKKDPNIKLIDMWREINKDNRTA